MLIRKKPNKSGSLSVQVIQKLHGRYKVVKTIGCATTRQEIERLVNLARQEIERLSAQPKLFVSEKDAAIEQAFSLLDNANIRTVGPEFIFGSIFDHIGFGAIGEELFRHLVIARLAFPLSKLKPQRFNFSFNFSIPTSYIQLYFFPSRSTPRGHPLSTVGWIAGLPVHCQRKGLPLSYLQHQISFINDDNLFRAHPCH